MRFSAADKNLSAVLTLSRWRRGKHVKHLYKNLPKSREYDVIMCSELWAELYLHLPPNPRTAWEHHQTIFTKGNYSLLVIVVEKKSELRQ